MIIDIRTNLMAATVVEGMKWISAQIVRTVIIFKCGTLSNHV